MTIEIPYVLAGIFITLMLRNLVLMLVEPGGEREMTKKELEEKTTTMDCVCGNPMTKEEWKHQWVCHRCGRTKPLHQTNVDKYFRNATDEEIAEIIAEDWCELIDCESAPFCDGECKERILAWLQQEADS